MSQMSFESILTGGDSRSLHGVDEVVEQWGDARGGLHGFVEA
jgi:hypothetical protein